ncbi:ABC transporter substrate-binding protein [Bradyrhizobium sp. CCGUVB1N3]|uniref:ABC transporter substrate-binding protein n=1 Tax=Bradyrhizobium sp. CCGUVB1N3 TaxID=2949629 RepID=UPI0020B24C3F|nr:ABC transporter substrate-binding protein [Bradyrhizobium sp. CCGUVB1N3]MCP3476465.1 ABC transporter substrate-binding protein [Bradyrhizobium sp. CCGUVB1N3]
MSISKELSRRTFLAGASAAVLAPAVITRVHAQAKAITITSYGGTYQDVLVKTVTTPFTEETGIKVNIIPIPDIAKLKAQAMTGRVDIDVVMTVDENAAFGSKQGLWDKIDLGMLDTADMAVAPKAEYVTANSFAGGIAWDPQKYGPEAHPKNFAEYFDIKKFPGRRTFRNRPNETLEAALLADGVLPKDMYPLDVDRAFKVLDRVKSSVASWVTATPQTISLLQTQEVDFSYSYANRVKATNEPGGGKPLAFSFEQNLLGTDRLAIPKGAPNKEGAMKYMAYFLRPDVTARLCNAAFIIPNSKKAIPLLDPEVRKWTPDITNPNNVVIDGAYWTENLEPVSRRFKEWVIT